MRRFAEKIVCYEYFENMRASGEHRKAAARLRRAYTAWLAARR